MSDPTVSTLTFECPLSERVRTWLRLEELFSRARALITRHDAIDHRTALLTLFDIVDTTSRNDLKSDLLQELDRQRTIWNAQLDHPDVAREALTEFLADMDAVIHDLHAQIGKIGAHLRESEWLQTVRQRATSPGGACAFELPMLQSWLEQAEHERRDGLQRWLDPLTPLEEAVLLVLRLLRETGQTTTEIAPHGNFHRALTSARPPLLARVTVGAHLGVVPEVSANKYTVNVRFLEHGGHSQPSGRASATGRSIPFRLALCTL
ncbi:MAG: cell division protein ZapD [Burkholderiales bacterium]|nr:cell division protein ZapD [Burkholderiales bacterium]